MVSKASEDLPEPDRPGSTVSVSRGISTSTFFRLCSRAPRIEMFFSMAFRQSKRALWRSGLARATARASQLGLAAGRSRGGTPDMGIAILDRKPTGVGSSVTHRPREAGDRFEREWNIKGTVAQGNGGFG